MSPSNSSKSHNGDPQTYQHMQQALFEFGKKNSGIEVDSVTATGGLIPTDKLVSKVSSTPEAKNSDEVHGSEKTEASLESKSETTPNPLLTSPSQQQSNSQQYAGKSSEVMSSTPGISDGMAGRLPVVVNLSGTKPIKPRPVLSAIEGVSTMISEPKNNPINSGSVSATSATNVKNSTATKVPERISTNTSAKNKGTARRRGKWTVEEEEYVARVIQDFNSGFLNAPAGYTLRSYLSDKLQCDPMRITKKFTGESCIGKRVFHPAVRSAANATAIDKAQAELDALERRWRRRLELQQRESAKKAAASAAAANAASRGAVTVQGVPVSMLGGSSQNSADSQLQQSAVTQAATWLDRANVILMGNIGTENQVTSSSTGTGANESSQQQNKDESTSTNSSMEDSLEHQMKEVQRLIYEGPMIQQTTAGLPNLILRTSASTASTDQNQQNADANTIVATTQMSSSSAHISPTLEPADKRMRINTAADSSSTGAEDAEALVGFLRSVRASAAAGQEF